MLARLLARLEPLPSPVVTLTGQQDVERIIRSPSSIWSVREIHLRIPGLSENEHALWQSRMDKHLQACGCGQAVIGTACLLGLFGAYRWLDPLQQSWSGWSAFFIGFGFAVAGAGLGKISGLAGARLRLRRTLMDLEEALNRNA